MNDMSMIRHLILLAVALGSAPFVGADVKYRNDFERASPDSVPEELMVLDGHFAVKQDSGNKFLELPGSPLDSFGLLFGPASKDQARVSARIFGTASGRKFPAFDVGLNGVGGYKLRVSPAKKSLELYRGDALKKSVPFTWHSGKWTFLTLAVRTAGDHEWVIEGKCWSEGATEPAEPTITFKDATVPPSGRASVGGMPFSGTPIRFDDLTVSDAAR